MSYYLNIGAGTMDRIAEDFDLVCAFDSGNYIERGEGYYCEDNDEFYEYDYNVYWCDNCASYHNGDNWNYDQHCCTNCQIESLINGYHSYSRCDYTPVITAQDSEQDACELIGYELEIDNGSSREECAQDIADAVGSVVYFEEDGSLTDDGFEIISQPHTFRALMGFDFEKVGRIARGYGYSSHDAGNCGLHLHFDRRWFGSTPEEQTEAIALVCKWYAKNWDILRILSRRKEFSYCRKENSDGVNLANLVMYKKDGSRYDAVNLTNLDRFGTVEFRLGRGTLNAKTIRAWIDLHRAIAKASRTATSYDFYEWINAETVSADTWEWIEKRLEYVRVRAEYDAMVQNEERETA